jgi:hypothetical protein
MLFQNGSISGSMATKEDARQPGNPGTLNKNCLNSGPPLSCAQHNTCIAQYKMHTLLFKPPPFS